MALALALALALAVAVAMAVAVAVAADATTVAPAVAPAVVLAKVEAAKVEIQSVVAETTAAARAGHGPVTRLRRVHHARVDASKARVAVVPRTLALPLPLLLVGRAAHDRVALAVDVGVALGVALEREGGLLGGPAQIPAAEVGAVRVLVRREVARVLVDEPLAHALARRAHALARRPHALARRPHALARRPHGHRRPRPAARQERQPAGRRVGGQVASAHGQRPPLALAVVLVLAPIEPEPVAPRVLLIFAHNADAVDNAITPSLLVLVAHEKVLAAAARPAVVVAAVPRLVPRRVAAEEERAPRPLERGHRGRCRRRLRRRRRRRAPLRRHGVDRKARELLHGAQLLPGHEQGQLGVRLGRHRVRRWRVPTLQSKNGCTIVNTSNRRWPPQIADQQLLPRAVGKQAASVEPSFGSFQFCG